MRALMDIVLDFNPGLENANLNQSEPEDQVTEDYRRTLNFRES